MGFESITLKKLHSFLVAADAACSMGDLPVTAVEARLAAVLGLATAAVPAVLAAAVPVVLNKANGAAQAVNKLKRQTKLNQRIVFNYRLENLLTATGNIKYSSGP